MDQALSGIRVLDLTEYIAGPFGGKQFADFGADVVKIENPNGGDPARRYGPFPGDKPNPEASGLFLHLNRNKRGITLDIATATGRDLLLRLVESADIVLESFPPGYLEQIGLGFDALSSARPNIVLGRLTPFGQTGPYRDYRGSDIVYYAFGPMLVSGDFDLGPVKKTANMVECQAGNIFATAVMGAYFVARNDGVGQVVDVAAARTQMGSIDRRLTFLLGYQYAGTLPERGSDLLSSLPAAIYPCADGYVQIMTTPAWVPRMLKAINDPELTQVMTSSPTAVFDPANHALLEEKLYAWLMSHGKQEAFQISLETGWPVSPVNTIADVMQDPHFNQRGFFVRKEHPVAGTQTYAGAPWRMPGGFEFRLPAPLHGQHNEEIFGGELGLTHEEIQLLAQLGIA